MLHVHHDVDVVEQHPTVLPLSLAAGAMSLVLMHGLVDGVDHGRHLTLAGRRDDDEDVSDGEVLRDVKGDDVEALLVKGGVCRHTGELDGLFGGAQ